MSTSAFTQLIRAAHAQPDAQRLLFVFAAAQAPENATTEQRQSFERGEGGYLEPLMCVDKAPDDLNDFAALVEESRRAGPPWQVVFVAALSGSGSRPPSSMQVDQGLQRMVDSVKQGSVGAFLAFDAQGRSLTFA